MLSFSIPTLITSQPTYKHNLIVQVKRSQTGSVEDLDADDVLVDIAARGSALLQSVASQGNQQVRTDI